MDNTEHTTQFIERLYEISSSLNDTTLILIGGSILMLIGTKSNHPQYWWSKLFYLLLLPGWGALAASFYYGDQIVRGWATMVFPLSVANEDFFNSMLSSYDFQRINFLIGCGCFTIWLMIFLFWWVFKSVFKKLNHQKAN